MAIYTSDLTRFVEELKQRNPYLEDEQRRGRSIYWDKAPTPLDEMSGTRDTGAVQQARRYRYTS